jgi:hypothetical protein
MLFCEFILSQESESHDRLPTDPGYLSDIGIVGRISRGSRFSQIVCALMPRYMFRLDGWNLTNGLTGNFAEGPIANTCIGT